MTDLFQNTHTHWLEKCTQNAPPYRSDYGRLGSDAEFLISFDAQATARIRRSGYYMDLAAGFSLVGMSFEYLFNQPFRPQIQNTLKQAHESSAVLNIHAKSSQTDVHFALYPLCADHGPIDFFLGVIDLAMAPSSPLGLLELTRIKKIPLSIYDVQSNTNTAQTVGFAEDAQPFINKAPTFRVIEGGKAKTGTHNQTAFKTNIIHHFKREP